MVATRGLTAIGDERTARSMLLEDSLRAVDLAASTDGPIVDVGSGGGAPGIPLALALPAREVVLVEAERRKCAFLERWVPPNARVVCGRVEQQPVDWAGMALAKALAYPPTAAEWCLPLVREGGLVLLWVGPSAERARVGAVAARIAGELEDAPAGLIAIRKTGPTPEGFPRRVGVARKRPLA